MKNFVRTFLKTALFWIFFFMFFRILFVVTNLGHTSDVPVITMIEAFVPGLRMDMSFTGYLLLLIVVMQVISLPISGKFCFGCFRWSMNILIPLFTILLLTNANLYRYWASHIDAQAFSFIKTPGIVLNSLSLLEILIFLSVTILLSWLAIYLFRKLTDTKAIEDPSFSWKKRGINTLATLFIGALMIVPIRGSFGVAPINTGVAYFSEHLFANHAAINPLWNLAYSLKRIDKVNREFNFMEEERADDIFNELMSESGDFPRLLNTDNPDIVVILLESFSSQAIKPLGGADVTPHFNRLLQEGIFFENIMSASVRSDYGLVATLTGYPGLPDYSIMQYPERSRHLNYMTKHLKSNGYEDLNFLYGGDMGFKNMQSLITLAGFDDVVSMDDFSSDKRGKKWGVHDEYTFDRFVEMIESSVSPSFNFFFTLSSHEPFDVPMEKVYDDKYLNSVHYTDRCLGQFFERVKDKGIWDNTLFVLIADHGIVGPAKAVPTDQNRFHIPMLWTGGALAVSDTIVSKYGSQVDLASTLLNQLDVEAEDFIFSKNIFDNDVEGFAFFHFSGGYGFLDEQMHQVFDIASGKSIKADGLQTKKDSLKAKAFLQKLSSDFVNNK